VTGYFSPDGKKVAASRNNPGKGMEIMIYDLARSTKTSSLSHSHGTMTRLVTGWQYHHL